MNTDSPNNPAELVMAGIGDWLNEQAALADKASKEWASGGSNEQSAYRSGMWYAYNDCRNQLSDAPNVLLERLREAEGKVEWRLIDTAPKDGTRILVCSGDGTIVEVARWAWERWMSSPGDYNRKPTWWMPIPTLTPPTTNDNRRGE